MDEKGRESESMESCGKQEVGVGTEEPGVSVCLFPFCVALFCRQILSRRRKSRGQGPVGL